MDVEFLVPLRPTDAAGTSVRDVDTSSLAPGTDLFLQAISGNVLAPATTLLIR